MESESDVRSNGEMCRRFFGSRLNIIYRDLKPENILLDADGIKLSRLQWHGMVFHLSYIVELYSYIYIMLYS